MPQLGGSEGNAQLTSMTAVALLVLLALEGVTVLFIRPLISVHVFVGLLLVPPVALKLASTAWRFVSYYAGRADYVAKGPPQIVLRAVVAPLVVVSTLVLFGTGIAMLAVHPRSGSLVGLHKASFIAWLSATAIHVLAYLPRLWSLISRGVVAASRLPSAKLRLGLVAASVAAGALFAVGLFHFASPWLDWVRNRR